MATDSERLDWLERNWVIATDPIETPLVTDDPNQPRGLRSAIDTAMSQEQPDAD